MIDFVVDCGADPTGVLDNSAILASALMGPQEIYIPAGVYKFLTSVLIPEQKPNRIIGAGFRHTTLNYYGTGALLSYTRTANKSGSILTVEDLALNYAGVPRAAGTKGINFWGEKEGRDDNWLRTYRCQFTNFSVAVDMKFAGQSYFVDNYYQANSYSHTFKRGASFIYMRGCMSFDPTFIHAQDTTNDGYSNGLFLDSCNNITATQENLFIDGWQAVFVSKCGWDLGSGGYAALWFRNCQDVYVDSCFISSSIGTQRVGVFFDSTHSFGLSKNTVVNNSVGVQATVPLYGMASKGTVGGNKFEGNTLSHVLLFSGVEGVKVTENHFQTQPSRTGTNFEVYGAGANNNIVSFNTFAGSPYTIGVGVNSVIYGNIFNVKP